MVDPNRKRGERDSLSRRLSNETKTRDFKNISQIIQEPNLYTIEFILEFITPRAGTIAATMGQDGTTVTPIVIMGLRVEPSIVAALPCSPRNSAGGE